MTTKNKWIALGDINPMEHGGVWIQKDSVTETAFNIVTVDMSEERENVYILKTGYIDITDEWMNKQAVMDYIGLTEETYNDTDYAIGCFGYYGYYETQGTYEEITGRGNAKKEIRSYGIVIANK